MTEKYDTLGMLDVGEPKVNGPDTLDGLLGFRFTGATEETATGEAPFADRICQRFGTVHGGVYAALAEMVASEGTIHNVWPDGKSGVGLSNNTNFLRPLTRGSKLRAIATAIHRGSSTWVWDVDWLDDDDDVCAVSRVAIAVRARNE